MYLVRQCLSLGKVVLTTKTNIYQPFQFLTTCIFYTFYKTTTFLETQERFYEAFRILAICIITQVFKSIL